MIFDARESRREALQNIAPGPPASIAERQAADFRSFLLTGASFSADTSIYNEYDRYLDEIRQATGRNFENPVDFAALQLERNQRDLRLTGVRDVAEVPTLEGREQQLFEELSELSEKFPNLFIRSPEQIRRGIADQRRTARANAASVAERDSGLSGFLSFFSNAGLYMLDPPVLASMAFAPGATTIARGAIIDAAIATAAEIPLQATIEASGLEFGEKPSFGRAATNVLAIGAGAGAFSGVIRTAGRGLAMRRARREAEAKRLKTKEARAGDTPAEDIGVEDGLSPDAKDTQTYTERQEDLAAQTPFGPEGAAEHAGKYSQALEAAREGRVADLGEPGVRPRSARPESDAEAPPTAFDEGDPLAATEKVVVQAGRDLAAETRAEAAKSSAGRAVRETFGPLDQGERASLLAQIRRPPKLPKVTRLTQYLVNGGGLRDPGGDVKAVIGGARARPGLMNNKTGRSLDEAGEDAFEAGFFDERPTEAELLAALADDFDGTAPRFSDPDDAIAFNESRDIADSLEELGAALDDLGIDVRALDDAAIGARIDALADDAAALPRNNDPAPPSAIDRARLAETRAAGAEDAEGEILAAMEAEVRDAFGDDMDAKLWVEDADGNPVQRSAREVFSDLDEEDLLLSEWLDCAGKMGAAA